MKAKLSLSLAFKKAALGLVSIVLTGASLAHGFTLDRKLNNDPAIIEMIRLLGEARDLTQVTQIVETSEVRRLYRKENLYAAKSYDKINLPLSTWRKLAQYYIYTGYQARLIQSMSRKDSIARISASDPVDCVILEARGCENSKFGEKTELNLGFLGLFNTKTISNETILQEARGYANSQILMANADLCKLIEQGLTLSEFEKFTQSLGFTNHSMGGSFEYQRPGPSSLYESARTCNGVGDIRHEYFIMESYTRGFDCVTRDGRVLCKENGKYLP
jgi:hypothetical protein